MSDTLKRHIKMREERRARRALALKSSRGVVADGGTGDAAMSPRPSPDNHGDASSPVGGAAGGGDTGGPSSSDGDVSAVATHDQGHASGVDDHYSSEFSP
jgi:hypothetical protein